MTESVKDWRIKRLQDAADRIGGNAPLGRALGYTSGAQIGHMLKGIRPITEKTIDKIEALPGLAQWFATPGTSVATLAHSAAPPAYAPPLGDDAVAVPLLSNGGSMGHGTEELHDDVMQGELQLSRTWLRREVRPTSPNALRFIHAYGDSMVPTFSDGDVLLVDTGARDAHHIDGIYVLRAQGRLFIKRVRCRITGEIEVSSDNATVKTVDVLDGTQPINVIGKVIWVWNGRKL